MISVVIGAQWGDEGKGKIVDLLSQDAHVTVRFHGGNNAGHTVINQYGKFPLHLVPAGIFNPKARCYIAGGVVLDLEVLAGEIAMLEKALGGVHKRLFISPRCHIILPYHKLLDKLYEEAKGKSKTGTTGRGIGPVYADKVSYNGIRLGDLAFPARFREKLALALLVKNKIIKGLGADELEVDTIYKEQLGWYRQIQNLVQEPFADLQNAYKKKKDILFEGAQGTFLDNDWGTYPFVTASSTVAGSITASSGLPAQYIKKAIGVSKAYTTRVGSGPFPTELTEEIGEKIRTIGNEFGATTGRPRRCGWFDAELVRFAAKLNGMTDLVLTKIDVLDTFASIKVCTGYKYKGKPTSYEQLDSYALGEVTPVYATLKGWKKSLNDIKKFNELPKEAMTYIRTLEKLTGVHISMISVGASREQTILRG